VADIPADELALLRAVRDNPDDDTPALVAADWYQERGDDRRAELIRVQCELPRMTDDAAPQCTSDGSRCRDPDCPAYLFFARRKELLERENALMAPPLWPWLWSCDWPADPENRSAAAATNETVMVFARDVARNRWADAASAFVHFRRGFPDRITGVRPADFLPVAEMVLAGVPTVRAVELIHLTYPDHDFTDHLLTTEGGAGLVLTRDTTICGLTFRTSAEYSRELLARGPEAVRKAEMLAAVWISEHSEPLRLLSDRFGVTFTVAEPELPFCFSGHLADGCDCTPRGEVTVELTVTPHPAETGVYLITRSLGLGRYLGQMVRPGGPGFVDVPGGGGVRLREMDGNADVPVGTRVVTAPDPEGPDRGVRTFLYLGPASLPPPADPDVGALLAPRAAADRPRNSRRGQIPAPPNGSRRRFPRPT
jgi:uncharacterized protein (TIGR02996 family)